VYGLITVRVRSGANVLDGILGAGRSLGQMSGVNYTYLKFDADNDCYQTPAFVSSWIRVGNVVHCRLNFSPTKH